MLDGAAPEPTDHKPEADSAGTPDSPENQKGKPASSLWQRFLSVIGVSSGAGDKLDHQIRTLTIAIEMYPDAATNYVMRGEAYLMRRDYYLARADFEQAVQLSEAELEQQEWGLVAQVMLDRAQQGLAKAKHYLGA